MFIHNDGFTLTATQWRYVISELEAWSHTHDDLYSDAYKIIGNKIFCKHDSEIIKIVFNEDELRIVDDVISYFQEIAEQFKQ